MFPISKRNELGRNFTSIFQDSMFSLLNLSIFFMNRPTYVDNLLKYQNFSISAPDTGLFRQPAFQTTKLSTTKHSSDSALATSEESVVSYSLIIS